MPRKSPKSIPAVVPSDTDLGLSELRVRLNFLEKENNKLLRDIEKKRTELDNLTNSIQDLGIQIAQRSAPFVQQLLELDRQIHEVFTEIFTGRKLGKQSHKNIKSIYYHLQSDGLISPKRIPNEDNTFEFANDFEFNGFEDEPDWGHHEQRSQREQDLEAAKPDRDQLKKIRQTFLRLAEIFHPDKAPEDADRDYHTEIMKEINQAYQAGDLAKLLAIEKQQDLQQIIDRDSSDDLTRQCTKVEAENTFLKDQFENLKKELRQIRRTREGGMAAEYKKMTKAGVDPIGEAIGDLEAQIKVITELHKFVVDFRDRRITIKDFLKGPSALMRQEQISAEELLLQLLSKF